MNVGRQRSTQSSLGWMEHCVGMGRDSGQVLEGLNVGWELWDCLWIAGRAMERGPRLFTRDSGKIPLVAVWTDWDRPGSREAAKGAVTKVWVEVMEPEQLPAVEDKMGSQSDPSPPETGSSLLLG